VRVRCGCSKDPLWTAIRRNTNPRKAWDDCNEQNITVARKRENTQKSDPTVENA